MLRRLSHLALQRPRSVAFGSGIVLSGSGDAVAQFIEGKQDGGCVDGKRVLGMAIFTATLATLGYVPLYRLLDRIFGAKPTVRAVLLKVACDNFLMCPVVNLPLYFAWTGLIDGRTPESAFRRCEERYREVLLSSWAIWIPTQLLNFTFVPLHLRVPFGYGATFVWATSVSFLAHRQRHTREADVVSRNQRILEADRRFAAAAANTHPDHSACAGDHSAPNKAGVCASSAGASSGDSGLL